MARLRTRRDWWDQHGPDSPENWDFGGVPDSELIACCLWEYARESRTIHMRADLHWCIVRDIWFREEYLRNPALKTEHDKEAKIIEERAKRAAFDYGDFADRWWKTDFPLMQIYDSVTDLVRDGARAWQRLPRGMRTALANQVEESSVLLPLAFSSVGELEELWKSNSINLAKLRSEIRSKDDDSEDAALYEQTVAVEPFANAEGALRGRITAALTVDFSRFTNQEIADAFTDWLAKNRPRRWKRPRRVFPGARQKGRKVLEYRVALERLGLMRLLHWHTPRELREELPLAWRKICRKERYFRREIRESSKLFHRLFPFLPKGERPHSEERNGAWSPAIQKMMDKLDREMGLTGGRK